VIIASHLTEEQEENLIAALRENKETIGWTMIEFKGLSLSIVQYRIHLIEEATPKRDSQHRLNSIMQKAIQIKLFNY